MKKDNKMTYEFNPQKSLDTSKYHHVSDEDGIAEGNLIDFYNYIKSKSEGWNLHPETVCRYLDEEGLYFDVFETITHKDGWTSARKFVEENMSFVDSVSNLWVQS